MAQYATMQRASHNAAAWVVPPSWLGGVDPGGRRASLSLRQFPGLVLAWAAITIGCWLAPGAWGQEKSKPGVADQAQAKEWAERAAQLALAEARAYEFHVGKQDAPRLELVEKPVLKWSNTYEASVYGSAFVWTRSGRPEVIACMFKFYTTKVSFDAEFHSLSSQPLTGLKKGEVVWQPTEPGTSLKPLEGAPAPAKTATGRLTQMREIARNFSADMVTVIEP